MPIMSTPSPLSPTTHPEIDIACPFLTKPGYSDTTGEYYCDYTSWAYGIFALVGLLLIVVPILWLICCIIKRQSTKKILRRMASTDSNSSFASTRRSPPYQPLRQDDKEDYGAIEHSDRVSPIGQSSNDGARDNSMRHPDGTSISSSKASLFPNFDEASLNIRNSGIAARPRIPSPNYLQKTQDPTETPGTGFANRNSSSPYLGPVLVPDSATCNVSKTSSSPQRGSAIYPALPKGSPGAVEVAFKPNTSFFNNKSTEDKPQDLSSPVVPYEDVQVPIQKGPSVESPIYNVLESPAAVEHEGNVPAGPEGVSSINEGPREQIYSILENPCDRCDNGVEKEASEKCESVNITAETLVDTQEEPTYNVLEGPNDFPGREPSLETPSRNVPTAPSDKEQRPGDDTEQTLNSISELCPPEEKLPSAQEPIYVTAHQTLPENISQKPLRQPPNDPPQDQMYEALVKPSNSEYVIPSTQNVEKKAKEPSEADPQEGLYMPLIPAKDTVKKQATVESFTDSTEIDLSGEPRKRFTSRAEYEEFLLDIVKSVPFNERNGCYVVRDSVTAPGSKVLTMYCKQPGSEKELYNFKINFTEDNQAYLSKSKKRFTSIQYLLDFLRESKDMLPCTLRKGILQEKS